MDFQTCHLGHESMGTYTLFTALLSLLSLLLILQEFKIGHFFRCTCSGFRDRGRFLKFPYLGIKPIHWQTSFRRAHKLSFYPSGSEVVYLRSTESRFRGTCHAQIVIFWPGTWPKFLHLYVIPITYHPLYTWASNCSQFHVLLMLGVVFNSTDEKEKGKLENIWLGNKLPKYIRIVVTFLRETGHDIL